MKTFFLSFLFLSATASAATLSQTQKQISSLDVSEDVVPEASLQQKLYSVQSRAIPLKNKFELKMNLGQTFAGNGFLQTQQYGAGAQFHFNDSWSFGLGYHQVKNKFSNTAETLYQNESRLPDVDFAKSRLEGFVDYNLFYGKMRLSQETIWYFDQYIGLGAATHELQSGRDTGPLAHAGFVFWISRLSARLELSDYYYRETTVTGSSSNHNLVGSLGIGYVF